MTNSKSGKKKEMIITDEMRLRLTQRARDVFKEEGDLLMAHLPIGGSDHVATKDDLAKLELRLLRHVSHQTVVGIGTTSAVVAVLLGVFAYFLR